MGPEALGEARTEGRKQPDAEADGAGPCILSGRHLPLGSHLLLSVSCFRPRGCRGSPRTARQSPQGTFLGFLTVSGSPVPRQPGPTAARPHGPGLDGRRLQPSADLARLPGPARGYRPVKIAGLRYFGPWKPSGRHAVLRRDEREPRAAHRGAGEQRPTADPAAGWPSPANRSLSGNRRSAASQ